MKPSLYSIIAILGIIVMISCNRDEPSFSPRKAPIWPEDSVAYMDLYRIMNLNHDGNPNRMLDKWRFATFEYDNVTKNRHIVRIAIYRQYKSLYQPTAPDADSIPSSIGRMKRLRYLEMRVDFKNAFTLPGEVFHCPLDTLIITTVFKSYKESQGLMGKLPPDVKMAKNTLRYLCIEHTALSELCEELTEMTLLEECRLASNRLSGKIPEYIGDMTGKIDLSYNYYTEYDWRQILENKNIPKANWNCIHNEMPPEMKNMTFPEEIMRKFYNQK